MATTFLQPRSEYRRLNADQFRISAHEVEMEAECFNNIYKLTLKITFRNETENNFETDFIFPLDEDYVMTGFKAEFPDTKSTVKTFVEIPSKSLQDTYQRFTSQDEKHITIPVGTLEPNAQIRTSTEVLMAPTVKNSWFRVYVPGKIRSRLTTIKNKRKSSATDSESGRSDSTTSEAIVSRHSNTFLRLTSTTKVTFVKEHNDYDFSEVYSSNAKQAEIKIFCENFDFQFSWRNASPGPLQALIQQDPVSGESASIISYFPDVPLEEIADTTGCFVLVLTKSVLISDSEWLIQTSSVKFFLASLPAGSKFNLHVFSTGYSSCFDSYCADVTQENIQRALMFLEDPRPDFPDKHLSECLEGILLAASESSYPLSLFLMLTDRVERSARVVNLVKAHNEVNWFFYGIISMNSLDHNPLRKYRDLVHGLDHVKLSSITSIDTASKKLVDDIKRVNLKSAQDVNVKFLDQRGREISPLSPPSSQATSRTFGTASSPLTHLTFLDMNLNQRVSKVIFEAKLKLTDGSEIEIQKEVPKDSLHVLEGRMLPQYVGSRLIFDLEFWIEVSSELEEERRSAFEDMISRYSRRYGLISRFTTLHSKTLGKFGELTMIRECDYFSKLENPKQCQNLGNVDANKDEAILYAVRSQKKRLTDFRIRNNNNTNNSIHSQTVALRGKSKDQVSSPSSGMDSPSDFGSSPQLGSDASTRSMTKSVSSHSLSPELYVQRTRDLNSQKNSPQWPSLSLHSGHSETLPQRSASTLTSPGSVYPSTSSVPRVTVNSSSLAGNSLTPQTNDFSSNNNYFFSSASLLSLAGSRSSPRGTTLNATGQLTPSSTTGTTFGLGHSGSTSSLMKFPKQFSSHVSHQSIKSRNSVGGFLPKTIKSGSISGRTNLLIFWPQSKAHERLLSQEEIPLLPQLRHFQLPNP
eukprot:CAMPEP_0115027858 /NCGR_PEP_ID=MMETSP0216-20121206/35856_1 /TAXON_ID=223996 /ORGANISM="Protocruzia adherens, Strain Boccale" /LENGTH=919 /DNA_ID=CAMNT_0002403733 /DNA_START=69 /DNA_END=2829 /DNA_ORIENTATION=+